MGNSHQHFAPTPRNHIEKAWALKTAWTLKNVGSQNIRNIGKFKISINEQLKKHYKKLHMRNFCRISAVFYLQNTNQVPATLG